MKTLPLSGKTGNVATLWSAPSNTRYVAFASKFDEEYDSAPLCYDSKLVTDDEYDGDQSASEDKDEETQEFPRESTPSTIPPKTPVLFDLDGPEDVDEPTTIPEDDEGDLEVSPTSEFLRWHHQLGHCSPTRIKLMASQGMLPKRLTHC